MKDGSLERSLSVGEISWLLLLFSVLHQVTKGSNAFRDVLAET